MRRLERDRPNSSTATHILRVPHSFPLERQFDVIPLLFRIGSNITADCFTRRNSTEIESWTSNRSMAQVEVTHHFRAQMAISYQADTDMPTPTNTFPLFAPGLQFLKTYRRRSCEWRTSIYTAWGVLGNWGLPVFCDQVIARAVFDMVSQRTIHRAELLGDRSAFVTIGRCRPQMAIGGFRLTVTRRRPWYAALIAQ